jgi:hypothetical protein
VYVRGGTAKLLTRLRPATGALRAREVFSVANAIRPPWLKDQLLQVVAALERNPPPVGVPLAEEQLLLRTWQPWG